MKDANETFFAVSKILVLEILQQVVFMTYNKSSNLENF